MKNCYITDTTGLLEVARSSKNVALADDLEEILDPDGFHVLAHQFLHNDIEWRTWWFVKVKGQDEPKTIVISTNLDQFASRIWPAITGEMNEQASVQPSPALEN